MSLVKAFRCQNKCIWDTHRFVKSKWDGELDVTKKIAADSLKAIRGLQEKNFISKVLVLKGELSERV